MSVEPKEKRSLLSSQARIQAPWIKVTIGNYTFGVFSKRRFEDSKTPDGFYSSYNVQYPSYIKRLNIVKINGQINQYTLSIDYPVRPTDDPNFFEKIFSSVSKTRKIVFSYGDSTMPAYIYKDEEAIITAVTQQFDLENSRISYTVKAVSSAMIGRTGAFTFINTGLKKPSDEIKRVFLNKKYGLMDIFTGMNSQNLNSLIEGKDKLVELDTKVNISPLDYILYLVSCMVPAGFTTSTLTSDLYVLTIHDDTVYDALYNDTITLGGPYFKVTRVNNNIEHADAYEVDIGYNTANIVSKFSVDKNENWSLLYDWTEELYPENYTRRIDNNGNWEEVYTPMLTSKNEYHRTKPDDTTWFTKLASFPINATITIQGLLRPAQLMQYVRLNVVFPGGNKHISSGLYIVTKQVDDIGEGGYTTTLSLTRINA